LFNQQGLLQFLLDPKNIREAMFLQVLTRKVKTLNKTQTSIKLEKSHTEHHTPNKYVRTPYCPDKMYAACITCCPLGSHGKHADGACQKSHCHAKI